MEKQPPWWHDPKEYLNLYYTSPSASLSLKDVEKVCDAIPKIEHLLPGAVKEIFPDAPLRTGQVVQLYYSQFAESVYLIDVTEMLDATGVIRTITSYGSTINLRLLEGDPLDVDWLLILPDVEELRQLFPDRFVYEGSICP